VFQTARKDNTRLEALLCESKDRNLWKDIFGETAYMVRMALTSRSGKHKTLARKRDKYVEMVQTHGAVQLSLGQATIEDLVNFQRKFILCRTDKNWEDVPLHQKSIQIIMMYEKLNREKVRTSALENENGALTGYF
jgi:hypothetical protein